MNESTQVDRLLEPAEGEEVRADDGISPRMPFPTSYVLNREQEEELCNHAMRRLGELEAESGREACGSNPMWGNDSVEVYQGEYEGINRQAKTWMGKRHIYDKTYKNEMGFRAHVLGGIFAESNLAAPIARRITRQMTARGVNYFFGTDPWFAIYPVGILDKDRADKADRYVRHKMDQAKLKRTQELAIERAFILGESVVKTSWANRGQIYKTQATVLVDEAGADILGADGDYIFENDEWIPEIIEDPVTGDQVASNMTVLKRDLKTPQPPVMEFVKKLITRRITHYKGPEAKVINFMDFLCPLEAESIQLADCVAHLYDRALMDLADEWQKEIAASASGPERQEAMRKAIDLLRMLSSGSGEPNSAQNSDSVDSSTNSGGQSSRSQPIVEIAEFHLRYDADGDGILEDVMLIMDRKSKTPIFYDYEANITPDGLRPFACVRVAEVPGRWYGIGAMEQFESSQQIIDLLVNRYSFSQSESGRVIFWDPSCTIEGRAQRNLELNGGKTYTLANGKKAEDALSVIYLNENKGENLMEMAEFFMQLMMNESGVANANDGNVSGMDSTKLATGIRNVEKSGQEVFSLHLGHLEPGISESLTKMVKLVFSNIDQMEVYRYFEDGEDGGEGGGALLREINPGDIANIEIDTKILLTRFRGEQILESYSRGWEIVEKFYSQPYEVQINTAAMAVSMLKAMQIANADEIILPTQMPLMGPSSPLNAQGMASAAASRPRQSTPNL